MDINGKLTEEELVDYIGARLKLQLIETIVKSIDYSSQEKVMIIGGLFTDGDIKRTEI